MMVAVASGKGGTGKTTVATGLALAWGWGQFLDCDVEEPNAHLLLRPEIRHWQKVYLYVPQVNPQLCTYCGECAQFCRYNALAVIRESVTVFYELCHGCGGCTLVCPEKAIMEFPREIGVLEKGIVRGRIQFLQGRLHLGEMATATVIGELKRLVDPQEMVILDAPPGTATPLVATVEGSDYCLLVTEPTPFGLHDLEASVAVLRQLNIPCGVIINREGTGYTGIEEFCAREELPILLRIPEDRCIAEGYARGKTLVEIEPAYEMQLRKLLHHLAQTVTTDTGGPR
ncbi:MAG TPA: (4Fe-4S)-binding protein [Armatimonadetes bacterium]|nr:(4Fe-4S)-binding protein [Armatimonadota bacterium]